MSIVKNIRKGLRAALKQETTTVTKRSPGPQAPKIGQILRNTTTGRTMLVVGFGGQLRQQPLPLLWVSTALRSVGEQFPIIRPIAHVMADSMAGITYEEDAVILGDGSGHKASPWPPPLWEVVSHLQGSKPLPWSPTTPEALSLAAKTHGSPDDEQPTVE